MLLRFHFKNIAFHMGLGLVKRPDSLRCAIFTFKKILERFSVGNDFMFGIPQIIKLDVPKKKNHQSEIKLK